MVRNPTEILEPGMTAHSGSRPISSEAFSAFPKRELADVDELKNLIVESAELGRAVYPRGGGSAWSYGGMPVRHGVIVETSRIDRVIDYPVEDMTITVEAGITLARLQAILAENDQYLPIDPPNAAQATLGGVMATGWTGPRRHQALRPRDQLIGIGFVDGLGRLVKGGGRVVKNVAGYDFPKLMTGSMGTLGVIVELTFKVRPRPESTAIAWVRVKDASSLDQLLQKLNLSATRPTAIEVLNRPRAEVVGEPLGLKAETFVVAIGFDESAKAIDWQCDKILTELPDTATCDILKNEQAQPLWAALTDGHSVEEQSDALLARVVTRPSRLAAFLADLDSSVWSVEAHGGQGIAMLKAIAPMTREAALQAGQVHQAAVAPWGGSIMWPKCPEDWKSAFPIWGRHRPEQDLMTGVKKALDPKGILNPGRFLGMD